MPVLAHISDLHFGSADPEAISALGSLLTDLSPDLVAVTGDLTQSGRRREFAEAARFLGTLKSEKLVIPGNHDVSVMNPLSRFVTPWSRFSRSMESSLNPVYTDESMMVMGLNSARRAGPYADWSRGRLSRRQIKTVQDKMSAADTLLKAVALHHPIEVAGGKAGAHTVHRAKEAIQAFVEAKVDIVLTGHVHQSAASVLCTEDWQLIVSKAGTATSTRTRGEPASINVITYEADRIHVRILRHTSTGFQPHEDCSFVRRDQGWQKTEQSC